MKALHSVPAIGRRSSLAEFNQDIKDSSEVAFVLMSALVINMQVTARSPQCEITRHLRG